MISSSSVGFVEENWDGIGGTDEMKDPINLSAGTSPLLLFPLKKHSELLDGMTLFAFACIFVCS